MRYDRVVIKFKYKYGKQSTIWTINQTIDTTDNPVTPCEVTARQHQEIQTKFRERKERLPEMTNNNRSVPDLNSKPIR